MKARVQSSRTSAMTSGRMLRFVYLWVTILAASLAAAGCAHYPINQPLKQYDPQVGYRGKNLKDPAKDERLLTMGAGRGWG